MKKSVLGLNLAALEVYCIFLIRTEILSTEKKEQQTSWQKYGNQTGTKNGLKQACESGRMLFISLESLETIMDLHPDNIGTGTDNVRYKINQKEKTYSSYSVRINF